MIPSKDDQDHVMDVDPVGTPNTDALKVWGWISYGLHAFVALAILIPGIRVGFLFFLVAVSIDLFHRASAQGSWQASHIDWRLWTVGVAGLMYVLTSPLWLLFIFPGWIAWFLISLWFLYRIVRGMIAMHRHIAVDV